MATHSSVLAWRIPGMGVQVPSGCWQNSLLCEFRTVVPISLVAAGQELVSSPPIPLGPLSPSGSLLLQGM